MPTEQGVVDFMIMASLPPAECEAAARDAASSASRPFRRSRPRSCGSQTPVTSTSLTTPTPGRSTSTRTASAGARPRGTPTGGTRRATTSGATTRPSPAPMARPAAPTPSRSKAARSGARSIRPSCRSSRTGRSSSSGIRQRWRRRARSHCRCVTAHLLHTRFTKRIGASMII